MSTPSTTPDAAASMTTGAGPAGLGAAVPVQAADKSGTGKPSEYYRAVGIDKNGNILVENEAGVRYKLRPL
jgi:hypothetical protein